MTTETETNRGRYFVTSLLPWLVAGGMLLVYLVTLNHSTSTNNIFRISELSGSNTRSRYFGPLTFLFTLPLRWLPIAFVGTALKILTAICSALVLALLARSVALLPHDRTHDQRLRELNEFSILSIPTAWLPPLFAALVCGLQMTFWGNATNTAATTDNLQSFATDSFGEMVDLLLFAYSVRCLLEYRISLKLSWIARFAFVYGLGMANNWLMIGLFPGFLAAIIWIRGLSFFNPRFLALLVCCGLAGLALILFFPIRTGLEHSPNFGFWQAFRYILRTDKLFMSIYPSDVLLLLSLTSLLPIFIIAIRWASYFGDTSEVGIFLTTFIFHIVHGLFFLLCIWIAFNPPFSAHQKGIPLLPLYFLGALSIGYFAGYFLLIFGTRLPKARRAPHPFIQFINFIVVAIVCFLAVTVPIFLIWLNLPQLRAVQAADAHFANFSALTARLLPNKPSVVLSDDPVRLLFLQNSENTAQTTGHLFLDTSSLMHDPAYLRSLEKKYPDFKLASMTSNAIPSPFEVIRYLQLMVQQHDIYYIHPSFGLYFEDFYMQPHGPVYQLKRYASGEWKMPTLTREQIDENQKIWKDISETELLSLEHLIEQPNHSVHSPLLQYFMDTGHLTLEHNRTAMQLGIYYARSLDYWGVVLERADLLPEAGKCFDDALRLFPESLAAQVNSQFNKDLRAGKKIVIEPPAAVKDKFGKHRSWTDLLATDGPFDDPSFCFQLGVTFAGGENYREGSMVTRRGNALQAVQQFDRVHTLAPDYSEASFWLCKLFLLFNMNQDALAAADQVLQRKPNDPDALFYQGVAFMQAGSFDKALVPLNHLVAIQTNNSLALMDRAIANLRLTNYAAAKVDYETLAKAAPQAYRIDFGLQEIAYAQKDTNTLIKYLQLYLTNYYQAFPTNFTPPETDEVKLIKQRLKDTQKSAP